MKTELTLLEKDPRLAVEVIHEDYWDISITQPPPGPYELGIFTVRLKLEGFPHKCPVAYWRTRIHHPNRLQNEQVSMSWGTRWGPSNHLQEMMAAIISLISEPEPDWADPDWLELWEADPAQFAIDAQRCTLREAIPDWLNVHVSLLLPLVADGNPKAIQRLRHRTSGADLCEMGLLEHPAALWSARGALTSPIPISYWLATLHSGLTVVGLLLCQNEGALLQLLEEDHDLARQLTIDPLPLIAGLQKRYAQFTEAEMRAKREELTKLWRGGLRASAGLITGLLRHPWKHTLVYLEILLEDPQARPELDAGMVIQISGLMVAGDYLHLIPPFMRAYGALLEDTAEWEMIQYADTHAHNH